MTALNISLSVVVLRKWASSAGLRRSKRDIQFECCNAPCMSQLTAMALIAVTHGVYVLGKIPLKSSAESSKLVDILAVPLHWVLVPMGY